MMMVINCSYLSEQVEFIINLSDPLNTELVG